MSLDTYTKAQYRKWLRETVYVRRLASPGDSPPYADYEARARVTKFEPAELVGSIQQYQVEAIVYADDLIANGLTLPITAKDKLVVRGKQRTITSPDDTTRRVFGELIAFEIKALG